VTTVVFDTTALSHFARAGRLDVLDRVTSGYSRVIPNEVAAEIHRGVDTHPALSSVLTLNWLTIVELDFPEVVYAATFKAELGGAPLEHLGECAVLALVKRLDGIGIVDDWAARETAEQHGLTVRNTLTLICSAYKAGELKREVVERLVDDLAATDMRLPVDGTGLFTWAYEEALLP
jgi:predicted nucleic acid-binding protein